MLTYILRRILTMIPTLLVISMLVFVIIQLPPGDYLESHIAELQSQGESVDETKIAFLREQYGLDKPMLQQYGQWLIGMLQGDFGYSFEYDLPVTEVVGDRLFLTVIISITTILFTWLIAFPIGIYSATISTAGATTDYRRWGFWDWRRRIFCWHWSCFTSPTSILVPVSVA